MRCEQSGTSETGPNRLGISINGEGWWMSEFGHVQCRWDSWLYLVSRLILVGDNPSWNGTSRSINVRREWCNAHVNSLNFVVSFWITHTSWPHGEHVRTPDWLGTGTETFSRRRRQQSRQLRCVFSRDSTPSGDFSSLARRGLEQHVLRRAALEGIVGSLGATACGRKVCARSSVLMLFVEENWGQNVSQRFCQCSVVNSQVG